MYTGVLEYWVKTDFTNLYPFGKDWIWLGATHDTLKVTRYCFI